MTRSRRALTTCDDSVPATAERSDRRAARWQSTHVIANSSRGHHPSMTEMKAQVTMIC